MKEKPLDRRDALWLLWGGLLGTSPLPAWGPEAAAPLDDHTKVMAQRLSQKTGVSVEQLIAAHKSGKGWEAIAKEYNVRLGPV
jgi:hypothetical protein